MCANMFGKSHTNQKQRIMIRSVLVTSISCIVSLLVFFVAGKQIVDLIVSDFSYVVVQGGVEDDIRNSANLKIGSETEGVISRDKFIEPVAYEQYGFVICDEIGLNAPLYYGDSENVLNIGAGHSLSSHMFGESGTILVGGHDTTFFKCLDKLKKNMTVTVKTYFGVFEYKVSESKIVQGSDYEMNDEKEQLVLYTCYPIGKVTDNRSEKILFICDKVSGPVLGGADSE